MLLRYFTQSLLLLTLITQHLGAQSKIEGSIADANGKSLPDATVLLISAKDSSLVKGTITNGKGVFVFEHIMQGQYIVSSSFTGHTEVYSPAFTIRGKEIQHVGTLKLIGGLKTLTNVTVSAKKPLFEQSIDRLTINVASSITSAGSTALDVLMRSPGIIVDQQNNTISMNGKDGVVIMINGKINRMPITAVVQMLAGMSAANIEKIELITTPPANLDAEGNAGFINIVMKINTQFGTNVSWTATVGYGKSWIAGTSMNFNHRKGSWNVYGDYSFFRNGGYASGFFYRKVSNGNDIESVMEMDRNRVIIDQNARLGIDYELTKKTTLGVLLSGLGNVYKMNENNHSSIIVNSSLDTFITSKNKENHPLMNYAVNLNLAHQFSTDQRLTINLDHMYYTNDNVIDYLVDYYNATRQFIQKQNTYSNKKTPIAFWVGSLDYVRKLRKNFELAVGGKVTISNFTNDVKVQRMTGSHTAIDPELTSKYYLEESIAAAYSSVNISMSEKTSAKVGLRYEYTNSNLRSDYIENIVDRHYGRLFPSIFVSHTIDKNNSLNFSYSRRITRPTFNDMAPFVYFVDPNTFFSGNPALQPSIADALKGDYNIKHFILSLSYTYEADPISSFAPRIDPVTNRQTLAAENQDNKKTIALTISAPFTINSWWKVQNNFSAISQQLNAIYKGEGLRIVQKNISINSSQSFTLPKAYTMELNAYYQSGGLFGIYRLKSLSSVNFGVQKKFPGKAGSLKLNISNMFGPPHLRFSVDAPHYNLVTRGDLVFPNRTLQLTYTRNFGNEKVAGNRKRTIGAEEERLRVNTN